jgi:acyl dehydratase
MVVNPATDWPYSDIDQAHGDVLAVKVLGFNMPASKGLLRFGLAGQVITNWMGDLGFLRSLSLQLPNHFLYEDTMWIGAEVTGKTQVTVGSGEYNAIQLKVSGHNQLGQTLAEGTAEVYLPEKGFLVGLPIGNPWQ